MGRPLLSPNYLREDAGPIFISTVMATTSTQNPPSLHDAMESERYRMPAGILYGWVGERVFVHGPILTGMRHISGIHSTGAPQERRAMSSRLQAGTSGPLDLGVTDWSVRTRARYFLHIVMEYLAMKLGQRLRALVLNYDTEFTELFGAIASVVWGALVLNPYSNVIDGPLRIMPEWIWGSVMAFAGGQQLIALFHGQNDWRKRALFTTSVSWLVVCALTRFADWQTPNLLPELMAIGAAWAYLRIRKTPR